jgi:hypothetical protein
VVYPTPDNPPLASLVTMFLNASTKAVPVSVTAPLPVGSATLTYTVSGSANVATTSGQLFAAGAYTMAVKLCTKLSDSGTVWLNLAGGTAIANSGLPIFGGGQCRTIGTAETPMPSGAVTAITDAGSTQVLLVSGG